MRRPHASSAFTLTELLVVTAIIGVLAAILIPVAGHVRRKADQIQGGTALRDLMTAVSLYANDNRGVVPGPMSNTQFVARPDANHTQLVWKCQPYLDASVTPQAGQVVAMIAPQRFLRNYDPLVVSPYFAVNNLFTRESGAVVRVKPWGGVSTSYSAADRTPKRLITIPDKARRVAIIDIDAQLQADNGSSVAGNGPDIIPTPLYGQSRNAAFWDGHIEQVPLTYNLWPDDPAVPVN